MKKSNSPKYRRAVLALFALFATCGAIVANDVTYWQGEDGAYLNEASNWDGTAPFYGTSSNDMGFKNSPTEYTVSLSGDLVCAGTWKFLNDYSTTKWSLNGHTVTFLSGYESNEHRGRTNIVMNGTLAFTNSSGTVQLLKFTSTRPGAALFLREKANFIGNVSFSDDGMKTLEVTDGAQMIGSIGISGTGSRGLVSGAGTVVNLGGNQKSCDIGDEGTGAKLEILDGAVVTNGSLLKVGAVSRCKGIGGEFIVSNATFKLDYPYNVYVYIGGMKHTGSSSAGYTFVSASHNNSAKFLDGAKVLVTNSQFLVGSGMSHSNLLYISGKDTTVEIVATSPNQATPLAVGQNGCWNEFHLTDGAQMTGDYIAAAGQNSTYSTDSSFGRYGTTSLWNRVTIDEGAVLNARGQLLVGWRHAEDTKNDSLSKSLVASNSFEIASGAKVTAANGVIVGAYGVARDNTFIVQGEGTSLAFNDSGAAITIGLDGGVHNGFEITGGATLSNLTDLRIGHEVHYKGEETLQATGSNNYFKVENTTLTASKNVYLGYFNNGGNRLYVGDGATMSANGILMHGLGQEVVISNGVLQTTGDRGLQTAYASGAHTVDESGAHKFSFYGQGRIVLGSTNTRYGTFTNACVLAFHVPEGGYTAAALESQGAALKFSDDTEFVFDFSEAGKEGLKDIPLIAYTGLNAEGNRIVISDELLVKMNAAATQARAGSKVSLSADGTSLTLRVGSSGFMILVR